MKQLSYISFGHKLVEDSNMKTLFCFSSYNNKNIRPNLERIFFIMLDKYGKMLAE